MNADQLKSFKGMTISVSLLDFGEIYEFPEATLLRICKKFSFINCEGCERKVLTERLHIRGVKISGAWYYEPSFFKEKFE